MCLVFFLTQTLVSPLFFERGKVKVWWTSEIFFRGDLGVLKDPKKVSRGAWRNKVNEVVGFLNHQFDDKEPPKVITFSKKIFWKNHFISQLCLRSINLSSLYTWPKFFTADSSNSVAQWYDLCQWSQGSTVRVQEKSEVNQNLMFSQKRLYKIFSK